MNYHPGEIRAQKLGDVSLQAMQLRRMLTPEIPPGAKRFIEHTRTLLLTYIHSSGRPEMVWIQGEVGMISAVDASKLVVSVEEAYISPKSEIWESFEQGHEVGLLFMEWENRRRFRVNGRAELVRNKLEVTVEQAFGNCPKYIQKRVLSQAPSEWKENSEETIGSELTTEHIAFIQKSDTFFVGSRNQKGKADTSHRGGNPGFVEVVSPKKLRIPDYSGNNMFSTLGNFEEDPRGVLLFPDFTSGSELVLYGRVEIDWEHQHTDQLIQRYWTFDIESWKSTHRSQSLDAFLWEYSPFNP